MHSNSIIPETVCADSDLSSSQTEALLNGHRIVAITANETENKSSSTLNAAAPNGYHHSAIEVPDESNHQDPLVLPEDMSYASNNNKEPGAVLLGADYHSYPLSTSDVPHKFDNNISEDSN
ncbi:unnamed protein product [Schistosoma mattheei]|uniref:Uncharacterized protein n=1 Tax=Schistosoma mattheei TaxID=31246 RepID=A0A183PMF2_9TREM|nr:unnamed protein product [Schistosoma mattheei]